MNRMASPCQVGPSTEALRGRRTILSKSGRPHECRTPSLPANPNKPGRPRRGKGVQWLRACLCAISKQNGGSRPWVEVDLNRCFNAKGYSLRWGRVLFSRLQADAFWRNLCKVRFVQKRLEHNGCFVILVAFRPYLKWDEEPLFYERDRKTPRHVRAALRSEDLELVNNFAFGRGESRHCVVHHTIQFPSQGTAVLGTSLERPGTLVEPLCGRENETATASLRSDNPTPQPTSDASLRMSLNNRSACSAQQTFPQKQHQGRRTESHRNDPQSLASKEGIAKTVPEHVPASVQRFILWLVFQLKELMVWTRRDYFNPASATVPFKFSTVFAFVRRHAIAAHTGAAIQSAWDRAVHQTHADVVDGLCRHPIALCVAHATRILLRDPRSRSQRMSAFYTWRKNNLPSYSEVESLRKGQQKLLYEKTPTP